MPGSPRASLLLADGSRIDLANTPTGAIATQNGQSLRKVKDGLLQYDPDQPAAAVNTLTTPRGGFYQVILADGTHVWLDVASSLTYNAASEPREIQLTGRAYFEVAPQQGRPFMVRYKGQLLEVLGTHFSIDSYDDPRTYVLQGRIRLSQENKTIRPVELGPGQQAILQHGQFTIMKADTSTLAWRNNTFSFDNVDIKEVLKEASRWYDVDIVYDTDIPQRRISGNPSRELSFQNFIKIMSFSDLHFTIKGDTLHVAR